VTTTSATITVTSLQELEAEVTQVEFVRSTQKDAARPLRTAPGSGRCPGMGTIASAAHDIERAIQMIRGHRVILDEDIARLYGVSTRRLNEAMRRYAGRFPGASRATSCIS
jgi:chemotaxis protein histidine kinase CheA